MTFKWEGAAHNVVMVESKDDYDNCFVPENMREAEEDRGGITFKARQEGTYYFVCGVSTNIQYQYSNMQCMHGRHLSMSSFCRSAVTVNLGSRRLRSPSVEPVLKD